MQTALPGRLALHVTPAWLAPTALPEAQSHAAPPTCTRQPGPSQWMSVFATQVRNGECAAKRRAELV